MKFKNALFLSIFVSFLFVNKSFASYEELKESSFFDLKTGMTKEEVTEKMATFNEYHGIEKHFDGSDKISVFNRLDIDMKKYSYVIVYYNEDKKVDKLVFDITFNNKNGIEFKKSIESIKKQLKLNSKESLYNNEIFLYEEGVTKENKKINSFYECLEDKSGSAIINSMFNYVENNKEIKVNNNESYGFYRKFNYGFTNDFKEQVFYFKYLENLEESPEAAIRARISWDTPQIYSLNNIKNFKNIKTNKCDYFKTIQVQSYNKDNNNLKNIFIILQDFKEKK